MKAHLRLYLCCVTIYFCVVPVFISGVSFAYEYLAINGSQQMCIGEEQTLSLMNYRTGKSYHWEVVSGGGSIEPSTGEAVTFRAPDENPGCDLNPTIRVTDGYGNYGELQIAITCRSGGFAYWRVDYYDCMGSMDQYCRYHFDIHTCNGAYAYSNSTKCGNSWILCGDKKQCSDVCPSSGTIYDIRTDELKAEGCCPAVSLPGYKSRTLLPEGLELGRDPASDKPVCNPARVSDPVSILNGNNHDIHNDLSFSAPGLSPLVLTRDYNSRSDSKGSFGYGWSSNYDVVLDPLYDFQGESFMRIIDETGRHVYFNYSGDFRYEGAFQEKSYVKLENGVYVWHRLDGSTCVFETSGTLVELRDSFGNIRVLERDEEGLLVKVTDHATGRSLQFHYAGTLVDHIVGPVTSAVSDGIWSRYVYDSNMNLVAVNFADGSCISYKYDDPKDLHNLTEKRDGLGHLLASWSYDDNDRVCETFTRDGDGVRIKYEDDNTVKVITDEPYVIHTYKIWESGGRKKVTDIDRSYGCPDCQSSIARMEYDGQGRVTEVEYANGRIDQFCDYDSRGNALEVKMAVGTDLERTIMYTYHPDLDIKLSERQRSVLGDGYRMTVWDYDDDENETPNENPSKFLCRLIEKGFTRDFQGNVVPYEYITRYTHNHRGQMTSVDGPLSGDQDMITFTYDDTTADLLFVTEPITGRTSYSDYDASGRVGRVTDTNGNELSYIYDGKGRIKEISYGCDGTTQTYLYNEAGDISRISAANGIESLYSYDALYGRLTRVTDSMGNYARYGYDVNGNRIEESFNTPAGEMTFWKRYDYGGPTKPHEMWREINPDDTFTEYLYDTGGNVRSVTDARGEKTTREYDIFGRLTVVSRPMGIETAYEYDNLDKLVKIIDGENKAYAFEYDDRGRLLKETSPDSGITTNFYDISQNMMTRRDADGKLIHYVHDSKGRLVSVNYADQTCDVSCSYDEGDNGKGRITGMEGPDGSYLYRYNEKGYLVEAEKVVKGVSYTTTYAYDPSGILTGICYPTGRENIYELDGTGRVKKVVSSKNGLSKTVAENIEYLPLGPMNECDYGNGTGLTLTYDLLYQITGMESNGLVKRSYQYDATGNIKSIADSLMPERSSTFTYDEINRLVGATGVFGTVSYAYDRADNRLSRNRDGVIEVYTYIKDTNRLTGVTGPDPLQMVYDTRGNLIGINSRELHYGDSHRIEKIVENGNVIASYEYNGRGQRTIKDVQGMETVYHYDQFGNLIGESTPEGVFTVEYVYLDGLRLSAITYEEQNEISLSVMTDRERPLSGIKVYAFNNAGSYTGISGITDENGVATFDVSQFNDDSDYKFRADYLSYKFWSEVVPVPGTSHVDIEVAEESTSIIVTEGGISKSGVRVYLFNESGEYLGQYGTTDESGAVAFDLPEGKDFMFRADDLGNRFFSETITITSAGANVCRIDCGGGELTFFLDRDVGQCLEGAKAYLFSDKDVYLGLYGCSDENGRVAFEVPSGSYRVRVDYMGHRFWSDTVYVTSDLEASVSIPHMNVTVTVMSEFEEAVAPKQDVRVYLFNEAGTYLGVYGDTDESGIVTFSLPARDYKVRADYMLEKYWSPVFNWCDETISINEGVARVTVTNAGGSVDSGKLYVFNESGSYLGVYGSTDGEGVLRIKLPQGTYNFRCDYMASRYWSGPVEVMGQTETPVEISTGGGTLTARITKDDGEPLISLKCYLFNTDGIYLGESGTTDDEGGVRFNVSDGSYKIRIDYLGGRFWTEEVIVPEASTVNLIIPHRTVHLDVHGVLNEENYPIEDVKAYLFSPSGSYLGLSRTTDSTGAVSFDVPECEYRVRADYLSEQYWSQDFVWEDSEIVIDEGAAGVLVSLGDSLLKDVTVYVFDSENNYLGIFGLTDEKGEISFRLPENTYRFRVDYQGSRFWATETLKAHELKEVNINLGRGSFPVTVMDEDGRPFAGVNVYAFSLEEKYTGVYGSTDESGLVTMDLADGGYRFRVDYLGYRFWSDDVNIPSALSSIVTIPHEDVTITVSATGEGEGTPISGTKIYLFTATNQYVGVSGSTDAAGQVIFRVPMEEYKVRIDYLGGRYWSDNFAGTDSSIEIEHGRLRLHASSMDGDAADARVYLFTETGTYLGQYRNTDTSGIALFDVPERAYKFRVDYDGTRYWSGTVNAIAHEEVTVEFNLDQLALNMTNDPCPARFDEALPDCGGLHTSAAKNEPLHDWFVKKAFADSASEVSLYYYYINDHMGTPLKVIDENGDIVWDADFLPFGKAKIIVNDVENNFRLPGQYYDMESGLHYNGARYYMPAMGRYMSVDPLDVEGLNYLKQQVFGGSITKFYKGLSRQFAIDSLLGYALKNPSVHNSYQYGINNPVGICDESGQIITPFVCYTAIIAGGLIKAYLWTKVAQMFINAISPCDLKVDNQGINTAYTIIGMANVGMVGTFGAVNLACELPALYHTLYTHPEIVMNASDFVQGAIPGITPPVTFPGLLGTSALIVYKEGVYMMEGFE